MIKTKKELIFFQKADRIMAGFDELGLLGQIKYRLTQPPILAYLRHMRCCSYYRGSKSKYGQLKYLFHSILYRRLGLKLGFSIGYDVFGYGLLIPHYGTIVVNAQCRIGNYAVLHTSTCIGGGNKLIGNGLYLGTGAQIMGKVCLGNGVSIASNSLVNKDFPKDNILLAGTPASVKKQTTLWFERDGDLYWKRVKRIEALKAKYGL